MQIHSSAEIDKSAYLAEGVRIGPFCIVGPNVYIGAGTVLDSHVVIKANTRIGEKCRVHSFATLGGDPQDFKYDGKPCYAEIGDRNMFGEYTTVHRSNHEGGVTKVGNDNFIMTGCHVAHDCIVGNNVTMSNFAQLGGHVEVEDRAVIGGLAAFRQFSRIGKLAMVGGTAGVMQDIPPFTMAAAGPPAMLHGLNRIGMDRNGITAESQRAMSQCYRLMFMRGMSRENAIEEIEASVVKTPEVTHFLNFMRVDSKIGYCKAHVTAPRPKPPTPPELKVVGDQNGD